MRDQPRLAPSQPKPRRRGKGGVAGDVPGDPRAGLIALVKALAREAARQDHVAEGRSDGNETEG